MPGKMREWKWIFDAITMFTVVLGVAFAAVELRQLRASEESQAVLQLYQTLQNPGLVVGSNIIATLPDSLSVDSLEAITTTGPNALQVRQLLLTFEGLGVMVYRGDIPIEWVDELFHFSIVNSWLKFKPSIIARRERLSYPAILEWHQWLAERLIERESQRDATPAYEAHRNWKPPR